MKRGRLVIDGNLPHVWPLELLDRRCDEEQLPEPADIPAGMQARLLELELQRAPWGRREEEAA